MEIQKKGETLSIHLNDLESANALSLAKAKLLRQALRQKEISLILCYSSGRVFCSGGDLKAYAELKTKEQGIKMNREIRLCLQALAEHPAWKVAFVHGDCFGGGLEFLACFNSVIAERKTLFGFWQNKMGLSFGWGGYNRLLPKLKANFLKQGLLFAELKTAENLLDAGWFDAIRSRDEMVNLQKKLPSFFTQKNTRQDILKDLEKNEVQLFEKLWWSKEHLGHLNKFANHSRNS